MSDLSLLLTIGGGTVLVGALAFFAYCAWRDGKRLATAERKLTEMTQSRNWWRDWANKLLARVRELNERERDRDRERAAEAKDDPEAAAGLLNDAVARWLRPKADAGATNPAVPD